ncbi:MAG TPA: hypothetical protein VHD76_05765 [Bryobacteraceae bacterium]|nr:hypothetical protein [Bryobacteraceae bacterium]
MSTTASTTSADDNLAFDNAYWASQPPEVQTLRGLSGPSSRAMDLATRGFIIDVPIMVWNWDPWKVMRLREQYGYTWVPSALQPPVQEAPGFNLPGLTPYDPGNPPAGSIKVSTNIADYPPYPVPTPPPGAVTDFVGGLNFGNVYYALSGDPTLDGVTVTNSRGTFLKHRTVAQTPFGPMINGWYEKIG